MMNILLLGSGGREHALAWKMSQSAQLSELYIAPGNAGTQSIGKNVSIQVNDFDAITDFIIEHQIDMLVVGPEDPLVNGIRNFLHANPALKNLKIVGPDKIGAQLEGSKSYAKNFMNKYEIPTAASGTFDKNSLKEAFSFLETLSPPYVLKADGLAAGKGVLIVDDLQEAKQNLEQMLLDDKFGKAGHTVVIEEFLDGIEISVFVLCDGDNYVILPSAKDYKRIYEGDKGLNTGGMGAVSPVPFANADFMSKVEERIVKPTIDGLKQENIDYQGFIFIGLMAVKQDPYVIEYNVRMGDPETEVVIPLVKNDLVELLKNTCDRKLDSTSLEVDNRTAVTVMMVSDGYPEQYEKGKEITGLDAAADSIVFHAGTVEKEGKLLTNGGRVLSVTSYGNDIENARALSYNSANRIQFEGKRYRKDLGNDLLQ